MELPDTAAQRFGRYRNRLKLAGIKMVLGGSPQGRTAFWTEPLLTCGPEGEEGCVGAPVVPPEMVTAAVAEFVDKGIQVFAHANGEAAIDMIIDARTALRSLTIDAAWQILEEDTKGSIAPGPRSRTSPRYRSALTLRLALRR
ncbi:MAG TPA: amidohydrolase family protein [Thioalkalivibrio sp.]|nr:amidohydrolase family protein [Thioalkalivibrio sp.]